MQASASSGRSRNSNDGSKPRGSVTSSMIKIQDVAGAASFAVKIHPRARRDCVAGEVGDALKIDLTAPPVEGQANEACIRFLADLLDLPRSSITIAAGQNSRNKIIRVAGRTAAEVRARLGNAGLS